MKSAVAKQVFYLLLDGHLLLHVFDVLYGVHHVKIIHFRLFLFKSKYVKNIP